jgi:hypothetical protein
VRFILLPPVTTQGCSIRKAPKNAWIPNPSEIPAINTTSAVIDIKPTGQKYDSSPNESASQLRVNPETTKRIINPIVVKSLIYRMLLGQIINYRKQSQLTKSSTIVAVMMACWYPFNKPKSINTQAIADSLSSRFMPMNNAKGENAPYGWTQVRSMAYTGQPQI